MKKTDGRVCINILLGGLWMDGWMDILDGRMNG